MVTATHCLASVVQQLKTLKKKHVHGSLQETTPLLLQKAWQL